MRKLVQVHFTLWILFRETEGSRDKYTSWRQPSLLDLDEVASATTPISVSLFKRILAPCVRSPASLRRKVSLCGILCE